MNGLLSSPAFFATPVHRPASGTLRAGDQVDPAAFNRVRTRTLLEACKWDPQVGDGGTLASFPLRLNRPAWEELARTAESLAAETLALEAAVLARPELLDALGLPRSIRQVLRSLAPLSPAAARVMRFDFHPTRDGWRLSEVNSDVPGGYAEASFFTRLMAEQSGGTPAGDPADALVEVLVSSTPPAGTVALLAAAGYLADQQVVAFLARELQVRGLRATLATPLQLAWREARVFLSGPAGLQPVDTLMRFYQAEWFARLPRRFGWGNFFRAGLTPAINPGTAIISESKRLPLLWDSLGLAVPTWRRLLPETRDPRNAPWFRDENWVIKSALSNNGEAVGHRGLRSTREWRQMCLAVWLHPDRWVAQRRFDSLPLDTPSGARHACVGVYTVNGAAAGAYARIAPRPLIDFEATDAALLIDHAL